MRPDHSHVVISRGQRSIWFHCDPGYPRAWREGDTGKLLNNLVHANYPVYVVIGNKRIVFKKGLPPMEFQDDDAFAKYATDAKPIIRERMEDAIEGA
jgi:hypothetical protein